MAADFLPKKPNVVNSKSRDKVGHWSGDACCSTKERETGNQRIIS